MKPLGATAAIPHSQLYVVLAPLRWWIGHPWAVFWWAVFWLTIVPTWVVMTNFELFFPPSRFRFLRGFGIFATAVLSVSFAQGLRVSWRRSRVRASLFAACLALYSIYPLFFRLGGGDLSLDQLTQLIGPSVLIIGGAVGLEYAARMQQLRGILQVQTASRPRSEATQGARRVRRYVGLVAAVFLALIVSLVVYPAWKVGAARSRAEALCAEAVVGGPVEMLHAKGKDLGLAVWSSRARTDPDGKVRPASITGWGGWMFGRWHCTIEHADGKVLGKRTYLLD